LGTGVKTGSIERVRDEFLDRQFRGENSKASYWESMSAALSRMENIMNETSEDGFAKSMDSFWDSLQDIATNPENSGARSVASRRAVSLVDSFNYITSSLSSIHDDLKT